MILTVRSKNMILLRVALCVTVSLTDRHLIQLEYLVFVHAACVACIHNVCVTLHLVHFVVRNLFVMVPDLGYIRILPKLDELIV